MINYKIWSRLIHWTRSQSGSMKPMLARHLQPVWDQSRRTSILSQKYAELISWCWEPVESVIIQLCDLFIRSLSFIY